MPRQHRNTKAQVEGERPAQEKTEEWRQKARASHEKLRQSRMARDSTPRRESTTNQWPTWGAEASSPSKAKRETRGAV